MRRILLVSSALFVFSLPAAAQIFYDTDGNVGRTADGQIIRPEFETLPGANPGEPTTGAGEVPTVETVPEGGTSGARPSGLPQANAPASAQRALPQGAVPVDPTNPGTNVVQGRPPGELPVVGATRLLNSLSELDRPLTPEEITAYAATVQRQIPLRPELIQDFRRRLNDAQRAQAAPPTGFRPNAITDTVRVSLGTGGEPPGVLTSRGTVSVVSFFDRTGAAWPVASYVIGDEDAFQVYPMQEGSNQLSLAPLVPHGYSNLVVSLVGTDQPLVVDVETSETAVHFRRDIVTDGLGPNAKIAPVVAKVPDSRSSDGIMMAFAQGAPIPPDANELRTDDPDVEAYRLGDKMYVRTNQTLVSPSFESAISGPGGINAYRLRPAPVALISRNGSITRVRISQ